MTSTAHNSMTDLHIMIAGEGSITACPESSILGNKKEEIGECLHPGITGASLPGEGGKQKGLPQSNLALKEVCDYRL